MEALQAIGWSPEWAASLASIDPSGALVPARVAEEHRGALGVLTANGLHRVDVAGRLHYLATGPEDLPGVGDWVGLAPRPDGSGTVQALLPRRTVLLRKAPERPTQAQLLAANVDVVFVVASAGAELRARRIERTLALAREGGAEGVVVLSKRDLAEDLAEQIAMACAAAGGAPVLPVCGPTGEGTDALATYLDGGRTVALIGPSGVGKSTLVNFLAGRELLATQDTRSGDDKGRHTTTHRQLVPLPTGGVLIDTPGLREVGLWGDSDGIDAAFPDVLALLGGCRFGDCGHGAEPGCAIRAAIEAGDLDEARWRSYQKLLREVAHLEARKDGKTRHEQRKARKAFAKAIRNRPDKRDR